MNNDKGGNMVTMKMTMATSLASLLLLAAPASAAELMLGEVHPLTGAAAYWGDPMNKAAVMAVDEINAAGGVKAGGEALTIKLVPADDQSNPTTGVAALRKVVSDGARFVIGPLASGVAPALKPIVESNPKLTQLIDGAVVEGITNGKNIFRNQPIISDGYNNPMIDYIAARKYGKVAMITDRFHTGFANSQPTMVEKFNQNGNKVVSQEFFKLNDTDFSAQLTNSLATNPDILVVRGYGNEATLITKAARQRGYKGDIIWQSQTPAATILKNASAQDMEGVISVYTPTAEEYAAQGSKTATDFIAKYKARYNAGPGELSAFTYDAVRIMAAALAKAGSTENVAVNGALAAIKLSDVPGLVNHYEPQGQGQLFNEIGQAVVRGTVHVFKNGDWTLVASK